MSDENQAALVDPLDAFVQGNDQAPTEAPTETTITESAPVEEAIEPEKKNKVQERMNKLTADKHEERRKREAEAKRADDLQAKLDEIESKKPTLTEPTLEQHDFDTDEFNKATVAYEVQEQVAAELASQKTKQEQLNQKAKMQQSLDTFNERATALGKDDFEDKANAVPELPAGVADAIMGLENGAEMVYHLGTHLDLADSLASMSPMAAMMELGKISASMSVKPEIKTSAAPDPIETLNSGSALNAEVGDEMSIDAWMAKFG
jgi:hypothetical protein